MRLVSFALVLAFAGPAQAGITTPKQFFGHDVGDDYYLSNYKQLASYWEVIDKESPRVEVESIGKTAEGRDQLMAVISSPANLRNREKYRLISQRLCLARGISPQEAWKLAGSGKAVVWIDGGLHATETLGAQQLNQTLFEMASRNDDEVKRILDNVILLLVHANPDGMDLVSDWYMRESDPKKRNLNIPRLYQKYIGHDNNRDSYAVTQAETKNMSRIMYRTWYPQIMYNHHQPGPSGTVMFAPPFRDPMNYRIDPQVVSGIDLVSAAMMERFMRNNMPGVTRSTGAPYSMWWNGGLRTTSCFHNIIGILTETIGNPTPQRIPFLANRRVPSSSLLWPIEPQEWHFKQSVDYSVTANFAILDLVSRFKEKFLYDIYSMGKRQIEMGSKDTWTDTFSAVEGVKAIDELRTATRRNPRGYILPSNQPDFPTAQRFVNSLMETGVEAFRATKVFRVAGKSYPEGSLIVRCDQPYRPHVLDMFEPQDYPNDIPAPGAPPTPPYDSAGYTPAFQMGVAFDRVLESFEAPTERLSQPITVAREPWQAKNGKLPMAANINYEIVFERLRKGEPVSANSDAMFSMDASGMPLRLPRIALFDRYGGSMPSGWLRWLFDTVGIPYTVVFPKELEAGDLRKRFDALILPNGAVPEKLSETPAAEREDVPVEFRGLTGAIAKATVTKVSEFLSEGGVVICIGGSVSLGQHLGLPVRSALQEVGVPLPRTKFYIPGSLLRVWVETKLPVAWGMNAEADVMFDESPALAITGPGVEPISTFQDKPLRSGWALGWQFVSGSVAMAEAKVGKGKLYLFCPEITFRAQSHGTFKLLYNALLLPPLP